MTKIKPSRKSFRIKTALELRLGHCLKIAIAVPLSSMVTLSLFTALMVHAAPHIPRQTFELAQKISALWQGNRLLYCDRDKAVAETLKEVKQLREIKTAHFEAARSEISFVTTAGALGGLDIEATPVRNTNTSIRCVNE